MNDLPQFAFCLANSPAIFVVATLTGGSSALKIGVNFE
jgi:hypothetical protein